MQVMTRDQAEIMDKLLQLANGSVALVEEAFTYARAEPGQPPTLDEII